MVKRISSGQIPMVTGSNNSVKLFCAQIQSYLYSCVHFCTQPSPLLLYTFLDCRTGLLNFGQITRLNRVGHITRLNRVDQSQGSIWVIYTHTHSPYVVIAQPKGCAIRKSVEIEAYLNPVGFSHDQ